MRNAELWRRNEVSHFNFTFYILHFTFYFLLSTFYFLHSTLAQSSRLKRKVLFILLSTFYFLHFARAMLVITCASPQFKIHHSKFKIINNARHSLATSNSAFRIQNSALKKMLCAFAHSILFVLTQSADFGKILNGTHHLAGVGVLVIIPRNNLYFISIIINLSNHGLSSIKE